MSHCARDQECDVAFDRAKQKHSVDAILRDYLRQFIHKTDAGGGKPQAFKRLSFEGRNVNARRIGHRDIIGCRFYG
jgi:hypothetical protein